MTDLAPTPSRLGAVVAPDTVRIERLLPADIDTVWAWLTDSELRGRWFAKGPMELKPGGAFRLDFLHSELTPQPEPTPERFKGIENGCDFAGTILACEPPRLLTHTFGDRATPSEVTYELTPEGRDTRLVLTHRRLPDRGEMQNVTAGWNAHLAVLEDKLAGRTPEPFWANFLNIEAAVARLYDDGADQ